MAFDKRNSEFAYLRKNCLEGPEESLYPSSDFKFKFSIGAGETMIGIYLEGIAGKSYVVTQGTTDTYLYNYATGTKTTLASVKLTACTGSGTFVIFTGDDGYLYQIRVSDDTFQKGSQIPNFTSNYTAGGFDGLYYWFAGLDGIIRILGFQDTPIMAFDELNANPRFLVPYMDMLAIFFQYGSDTIVWLWDKANTTFIYKRSIIKNARLLSAGAIDDALMLVYSTSLKGNAKEQEGKIVASRFNGEKFADLNSIRSGMPTPAMPTVNIRSANTAVGSKKLFFAVVDADASAKNADLFKNYIYRVEPDGAIEVMSDPNPGQTDPNYALCLCVDPTTSAGLAIGVDKGTSNAGRVYENLKDDSAYDDYDDFTTTKYITNFLTEPFSVKRLEGFNVVFEKLFEDNSSTGEKGLIYYRTSERQDWTLLGEFSTEKVLQNVNARTIPSSTIPVKEQRYQFTKMPDLSALPEFNEIQYKFELFNGMSIIGAWHEYSYVTRNTLK